LVIRLWKLLLSTLAKVTSIGEARKPKNEAQTIACAAAVEMNRVAEKGTINP
jgi:hypothetical protein